MRGTLANSTRTDSLLMVSRSGTDMRSRFRTALKVTTLLIFSRIAGLGSLYNVLRFERLNRSPPLFWNQLEKLPFKHLATWVASGIGRRK